MEARTHSIPDQIARFARAQEEKNDRYLDITTVYEPVPAFFAGKSTLVVGGNRGLGFAIVQELVACKAKVIATCRGDAGKLSEFEAVQVVSGVDVTVTSTVEEMAKAIAAPVDIIIVNAGYFPDIHETLTDGENPMNFEEELKQIDVCALGPLRSIYALHKAGKIVSGTQVIIISSQAGSADWRTTQNADEGGDYGHHMSRAACNIGGVLMSEELKKHGIPVVMLHPGFNRTDMTAKYSHIWDIEGAVEKEVGAKRVLYEVAQVDMAKTGQFINCEDGLQIPF